MQPKALNLQHPEGSMYGYGMKIIHTKHLSVCTQIPPYTSDTHFTYTGIYLNYLQLLKTWKVGFWLGAGYHSAVSCSGNSHFSCRISPTRVFFLECFAIFPLCSLSRLPTALCYHLLYTVLTSSFKQQPEIHPEILKSTWISVWVTGQQKKARMQSASGSAETPLLMF